MNNERSARVRAIFQEAIRVHERARDRLGDAVLATVDAMRRTFDAGAKVLVFGNGGSAADSQHLAAELVGRFMRERRALPAVALTTDTSVLTGIGNDFGYDRVFARQVEALGKPGDLVIGITTSGESKNVVAALSTARRLGLTTIVLTGREGKAAGGLADILVNVPETSVARVQEVHRTILHAICELLERDL